MNACRFSLLSLAGFYCVHFNAGGGWSYTNPKDSPGKWPRLFPAMCAGYAQSPIDIVPSDAVPLPKGFGFKIKLSAGPKYNLKDKYQVINNGHSGKLTYVTLTSSSSNQHKARPLAPNTKPQ